MRTRLAPAFALLVTLCGLVLTAEAAPPLSAKEEKALEKRIEEGCKAGSWADVATAIDALAEANKKKAFEAMLEAAERAPATDGQVAQALGRAVGRMDDKGVKDAAKKALTRSPSPAVRRALLSAFSSRQEWDGVLAAINDTDESVAATAVRALCDARVESAVDPLVKLMVKLDATHGGVWDVLRLGLGKLLGVKLDSGAEYESRWGVVKAAGGLSTVKAAPVETGGGGPAGGGATVTFFGTQVEHTRVVFVLDISGSMKAVDPPPPGGRTATGEGGGDDGSKVRPGAPGGEGAAPQPEKNRLERAQAELKKVLSKLPAYYKVNVIVFDDRIEMWRTAEPPVLHPLEPANRAEALTYVDGFQPRGATNTVGALERAFQVENVRCIYLLSDGAPYMDGKNVPADDVLAVVQRNADKGVVIHTLAFPGVPKDMMKAIADRTGGTYRDIQ